MFMLRWITLKALFFVLQSVIFCFLIMPEGAKKNNCGYFQVIKILVFGSK